MKKTEILKVRVDINTHTALMRHCQRTGQSPSCALRKMVEGLVEPSNQADEAQCNGSKLPASNEIRSICARSVAAILIAEHSSLTGRWLDPSPHKRREVARLVEALFRCIYASEDEPLAYASPEASMDHGPWARM
jgi:hypothetical protein